MRRERLRPAYDPAELGRLYAVPHDHRRWRDHVLRVAMTTLVAQAVIGDCVSVADLSCGDGAIVRALGLHTRYLGDYAPGYQYTGPIEQTIEEIPAVDLFICTETIEHLDDPDEVLVAIRKKAPRLVLSTPVDAWGDTNPEHYWAFSREAVDEMLAVAGFQIAIYASLDLRPVNPASYCFGIWGAVS